MRAIANGRFLRMLRIKRGWRQRDVGLRAGVSAAVIGRHENGIIGSLAALERHAAVFALRLDVRLLGRAGELVRLADEEHAAIVERVAASFRGGGFLVEPEASFNEWGERGRIDLLAYDPRTGTLIVVEAKSLILDLQDLVGTLNMKERIAIGVGRKRGWAVSGRCTVLAVASTAFNREMIRRHPTLFVGYAQRRLSSAAVRAMSGRILCWVSPDRRIAPGGSPAGSVSSRRSPSISHLAILTVPRRGGLRRRWRYHSAGGR